MPPDRVWAVGRVGASEDRRARGSTVPGPGYQVPGPTARSGPRGAPLREPVRSVIVTVLRRASCSSSRRGSRSGRRLAPVVAALVGAALVTAGCSAVGGPSFDPAGPCRVDGRAPGAYPELEALVPARFDGRPPERLDSGRNCSPENLGGLAAAGITEVRFAGGLWPTGAESGVTLAVFSAPRLTVEALGAWYEAGARSARKTSNVVVTRPTISGATAFRIDLENDGQLQTIVVHRAARPDTVRVVLVGSAARDVRTPEAHAAIVERAVAASIAADG